MQALSLIGCMLRHHLWIILHLKNHRSYIVTSNSRCLSELGINYMMYKLLVNKMLDIFDGYNKTSRLDIEIMMM